MAKRTATADLNQDNWKEEEGPEDSGIFQKASPKELKMRTIKRGKRRGLKDDGESTSVFKNFKAFTPTNTETTTPTFSFLSGSSDKPKLTNTTPFSSFSFGNKNVNKSSDTTKIEVDSTSNNERYKIERESTSSNLKFNFSAGADTDKPPSSLMPSFNSTKTSDFPKPSSPESTNFGANAIGSESSKTPTTFKFGINSKENEASRTVGETTFKFGTNVNEDEPNKTPVMSTFKFGSKEGEASKLPGNSTFKFGISSKENDPRKTTVKSTFKHGVNSAESEDSNRVTTSFQLGTQSAPKLVSASPSSKSDGSEQGKSSSLRRGTKNSSSINGLENANSISGKGNNSNKFLAKLKTLNFGVLKWVTQHLDKNPFINLKPIFDDYEKHFQEIKRKYSSSIIEDNKSESALSSEEAKLSDKQTGSLLSGNLIEKSNASTPSTSAPLLTFNSSANKSGKAEPFVSGGQASSTSSVSTVASVSVKKSKGIHTTEMKPFTFGVNSTSTASNTASQKTNSNESASSSSSSSTPNPVFSFGLKDKSVASFSFGSSENKPTFSFGSPDSSTSGFNFGAPKDGKPLGFTFQPSSNAGSTSFKPSSSSSTTSSATSKEKKEEEEQEATDEVPKVEVTEVKEDDAIYEKKVKLFYKKEGHYIDKGVGTLFLKPAGQKTQLVVRALTNLGTILLNIILNESIPTQRVGKNNVLIVCVPNPPLEPKSPSTPVSMIIRVKTEGDADELLEKINEHKK